jgi:hypothetical protein
VIKNNLAFERRYRIIAQLNDTVGGIDQSEHTFGSR